MKSYPKRHMVKFYQSETRKVEVDGETVEQTVKVYYKYAKTATVCPSTGYDPINEGLDIRAYVRQLSANERNTAKAIQDDSSIEVAINKRKIVQDMCMEFNGDTYQIGAIDAFEFEGTEIKFRAKEVVPVEYDTIEYRRYEA